MVLGFLSCTITTLLELFIGFAIPAYLSLKLVAKMTKEEEEKEENLNEFKQWVFYWILRVSPLMKLFELIPYGCVLKLIMTVLLVSPKINLKGKIYSAIFDKGPISDKL